MIIGAVNQTTSFETRVCLTPQTAAVLRKSGFDVLIEKSAGLKSGFSDNDYQNAGASVKSSSHEVCSQSDILLCLAMPEKTCLKNLKEQAIIVGNLENADVGSLPKILTQKKITCLALEKLPRLSRAQPFDILSSQNNLSGYRAIIEAVHIAQKAAPMMITSAGTLPPLKFLIVGIGVAGLQAIATAKRLGGKVYASDPRAETKDQVQSLGATYIEDINGIISQCDIIISSAFSAGRQAPVIIDGNTLRQTPPTAVLIDMAAKFGGNIEGSKDNEAVFKDGRTIYGNSNFAAQIPYSSSTLLANNFYNFINYISSAEHKNVSLDFNDQIIREICVLKG